MGSHAFGKHSQSSQQTTTNQYSPPDWAREMFKRFANDASGLYNSGQGGHAYGGQRVSDLSDLSKNAMGNMTALGAKFNNPYLNNILQGSTAAQSNLADLASGKMVGHNSDFQAALNNGLDGAASTINSQMSGAGRYGSGANNAVLANKLGNIASSAKALQYNQDVANMMNANGQIDRARLGQVNGAANLYGAQSNQLAGQLHGGAMQDKNNQDKLNANWQAWLDKDNQGWNRLQLLKDAMNAAAGRYGSNSSQRNVSSNESSSPGLGGILSKLIGK